MPRHASPTTGQTVIYALCDPRDHTVRYVGRTGRPGTRVAEHSREGGDSVCRPWLAELALEGLEAQLRILDMVPKEAGLQAAHQREKAWIRACRRDGCPLLNRWESKAVEWLYRQGRIAA